MCERGYVGEIHRSMRSADRPNGKARSQEIWNKNLQFFLQFIVLAKKYEHWILSWGPRRRAVFNKKGRHIFEFDGHVASVFCGVFSSRRHASVSEALTYVTLNLKYTLCNKSSSPISHPNCSFLGFHISIKNKDWIKREITRLTFFAGC